jgi:DNA polymerase-1
VDPTVVATNFELNPQLEAGVSLLADTVLGRARKKREQDVLYIDTVEDLEVFVDAMIEEGITEFALDCEWGGGQHYLDQGMKLRTIQLAWSGKNAAVIILHRCGMRPAFSPRISDAYTQLQRLLCRPEVKIIGHNVGGDIAIIREAGVDLINKIYFDTMLASHLFEPTTSHGLEDLTVRWIQGWERHDLPLQEWRKDKKNNKLVNDETAYAYIPDSILHPYGAGDVCATFLLYRHYTRWFEDPEYSSLRKLFYELVMPAYPALVEIEVNGVKMDIERLAWMEQIYRRRHSELLDAFRRKISKPAFNPNSPVQKADLLFGELGLTPIKTTGNAPLMWDEVLEKGIQDKASPSTDDESLSILAGQSSVASDLRDICLIGTVLRNNLTPRVYSDKFNDMEYKKGLIGFTKDDGRLHTRISQMLKTGRLASYDPNIMNMPKKQESEVMRVLNMEGVPGLRSCFIADEGNVLVVSDYKQAEVATLAYLSQDPELMKAVAAGEDIHSTVCRQMFKLDCTLKEVKEKYSHLRVAAKSILFG